MALIEKLQEIKTKIESGAGGGSGEDLIIEDCQYLFYGGYRTNLLSKMYKYLKPTTAINMFGATSNLSSSTSQEELNYINKIDFTNCINMSNCFQRMNFIKFPTELVLDLPLCTSMDSCFYGYAGCSNLTKVILKNTYNVKDWDNCFYTGFNSLTETQNKKIEELEIDMSACTSCNYFFNSTTHTHSCCKYLSKITFTGSFGGNSTSSTLTLDLSKLEAMTKDAFVDMFTSLGENINGKTRIIQISATIYDTMSENELAIATNKGYTITSA